MPELIHHSYLLRLWREHQGAPLRVTLIAVAQPDAHQHFADLEALCAFLRAQAATPNGTSVHLDASTTIVAHMEAAEK